MSNAGESPSKCFAYRHALGAPSIGTQEMNGQQKTGRGRGQERKKCKCISLAEDNKILKLLNSISLFLLANSNSYGCVAS